jgi:hypothetical protein
MAGALKRVRIRMQTGVALLFCAIALVLSALTFGVVFEQTKRIVREASFHYVNATSKRAVGKTVELFEPIGVLLDTMAVNTSLRWLESEAQAYELFPTFLAALRHRGG